MSKTTARILTALPLAVACLLILGTLFRSKPTVTALHHASTPNDTDKVWNYGSKKAASGVMTLRGTYWCGVTFDDAGIIGIAVSRGDAAALAGLLARDKAFQVEGGTRVVTGGEIDMGISLAIVESGFQSGRKCYIPMNALK